MSARTPTAAIVIIGNEILSGKTQDTNGPYLIGELKALGVDLREIAVVPDIHETIAETVTRLAAKVDFVFTSGGVGPTHDDITIEAVARAFGRRIVREPSLEKALRWFYQDHLTDAHLRMADVPEGAELVYDDGIKIPTLRLENVYVLPGIPELCRMKFATVRERFRALPFHLRQIFVDADEGLIADAMTRAQAAHPSVAIGSYPRLSNAEYRVKVTLESKDKGEVDVVCDELVRAFGAEKIVRVE
ncbi:MAG: competence/damage-inducible protein A [Deltaproteobacteria bacterium]|nr:competence/damage-inducible protein A [Deltaproteobacteria bacterium]